MEEKSKKEIFKEVNKWKRMDKVYRYVYADLTSFEDLKKHSEKFQEINAMLKEEDRKRKEKKERKKHIEISLKP